MTSAPEMTCLPATRAASDERGQGGEGDHVEDRTWPPRRVDDGKARSAACGPPVMPIGVAFTTQRRGDALGRGGERQAQGRRELPARRLVAGDDRARREAGVDQRGGDGLGHPAAAVEDERGAVQGVDEASYGDVVGVRGGEALAVVDDRVDRADGARRVLDHVDERDHRLLERHRHRAAADAEGAYAADRRRDVGRRERLVEEVEAEHVVEVVVEAGADVARSRGQRDAQPGVLGQRWAHPARVGANRLLRTCREPSVGSVLLVHGATGVPTEEARDTCRSTCWESPSSPGPTPRRWRSGARPRSPPTSTTTAG